MKKKPSEEVLSLFKADFERMKRLEEELTLVRQRVAGAMLSAAADGLGVSSLAEAVGMDPRSATKWANKYAHKGPKKISRGSERVDNGSKHEYREIDGVGYVYISNRLSWAEVDADVLPAVKELGSELNPSGRIPHWAVVKRDVTMRRGVFGEHVFLAQAALGVDREWFRDHTVNYRDGNPLNCKRDNLEPVPRSRALPSGNSKTSRERRRKLLK